MKFFIYLFIFLGCSSDNIEIFLVKNNVSEKKTVSGDVVKQNIDSIVKNSSEILRLAISDDYMTEYYINNSLIEINFNEFKEINSPATGRIEVNKLILPLTGDLAPDSISGVATLILYSKNGLLGNPVRIKNGYNYINNIKTLFN